MAEVRGLRCDCFVKPPDVRNEILGWTAFAIFIGLLLWAMIGLSRRSAACEARGGTLVDGRCVRLVILP